MVDLVKVLIPIPVIAQEPPGVQHNPGVLSASHTLLKFLGTLLSTAPTLDPIRKLRQRTCRHLLQLHAAAAAPAYGQLSGWLRVARVRVGLLRDARPSLAARRARRTAHRSSGRPAPDAAVPLLANL